VKFSAVCLWVGSIVSLVAPTATLAQIIPDTTLPTNSTVIPGCTTCAIDGGTVRGVNLFHSFREFSVPTGGVAQFNNAPFIQNILTRVTGSSPSSIDGVIRANGTANVFLLNPNGIVFGSNAALQIGGSFLATTANSFKFADGSEFSAINPQAPPLLTVNVPIGLQFGNAPRRILNQSQTTTPFFPQPVGLTVLPGRTLAIAGGDVVLDGGNLTAFGGRVELGSVQSEGLVSLIPIADGFTLSYPATQQFGAIQLSNGADVKVGGDLPGAVQVQGRSLQLSGNSRIYSFNLGSQPAGSLSINMSESVEVTGNGREAYTQILQEFTAGTIDPLSVRNILFSTSTGSGAASDIVVNTPRLILQNGAFLANITAGTGNAGNVTINAAESANLDAAIVFTGSAVGATGNSGSLTFNTNVLTVQNNAQLSASAFGTGGGGRVAVNAADSIQLIGSTPIPVDAPVLNNNLTTGIFTTGVAGEPGNIDVTTRRLSILGGALIGADDLNAGGQAQGGNVTIVADAIALQGKAPNGQPSEITSFGVRQGGNVVLRTNTLTVQDEAGITVRSLGNAGNLDITADFIQLNNQGFLEATSLLGEGGNIQVNAQILELRRNSSISTSAGLLGGSGSGGNITINAAFVVGVLSENSDIRANAFAGSGGNITITANGIFGLRVQPRSTRLSDITASSALGISGTIVLNTFNVDPSRGVGRLPTNLSDQSKQVVQTCASSQTGRTGNRFVVVGRGGLPPSPEDTVDFPMLVAPIDGVGETAGYNSTTDSRQSSKPKTQNLTLPIVEAQGWAIAPDGSISLVAQANTVTPHSDWQTPIKCPQVEAP
jgi:filamentous hemagglutinin family protein